MIFFGLFGDKFSSFFCRIVKGDEFVGRNINVGGGNRLHEKLYVEE